jgi:hypothetical protein
MDEIRQDGGPYMRFVYGLKENRAKDFQVWRRQLGFLLLSSKSAEEFACEASFSLD